MLIEAHSLQNEMFCHLNKLNANFVTVLEILTKKSSIFTHVITDVQQCWMLQT